MMKMTTNNNTKNTLHDKHTARVKKKMKLNIMDNKKKYNNTNDMKTKTKNNMKNNKMKNAKDNERKMRTRKRMSIRRINTRRHI